MWNLRSEDRLREWKTFRKSIAELSFDSAIKKVVHLWSYAPISNTYIDYTQPSEFASPWELLLNDGFDDASKSLGMLYTLYFSKHQLGHKFNLVVLNRCSTLNPCSVVFVDDGKYILNYEYDDIVDLSQLEVGCKALYSYTEDDLRLSTY